MVLDLGGSGKPKNKKFQGHQLNIEINKKNLIQRITFIYLHIKYVCNMI